MSAFPTRKTFELFDFSFQPYLDINKINELRILRFIDNNENVIFLDTPWVGKTHLAIALYHSDISVSSIERNLLDDEDVVRIIMGYRPDETHVIRAKSDFVTKASASIYRNLFNNRVSVVLSQQ